MGAYLVSDLSLPAMCEVELPSPLCLRCSALTSPESQTPVHAESVTLLLSQMLVTCHL